VTRHHDLAPLVPTLAWFYATLEAVPDLVGISANENDRPASVPDVNPELPKAEMLLADFEAGAVRFSDRSTWRMQFVRVKGELEPRNYYVPAGALTHIWGRPIAQEVGRERDSEALAAVLARKKTVEWYCTKLRAIPPLKPRKSFRRRKPAPPVDWTQFAHVRGDVPLDKARAASGLPPLYDCALPGLPYAPEPSRLFLGLGAGRGSRSDGEGTASHVKRPDPDAYTMDRVIIDRAALEQFRSTEPEHFATLLTARTAGSMSDLVASNDNATGKRRLSAAASALKDFLAA